MKIETMAGMAAKTETVRYGLIGAGMMGREHIRNLALIPGAVVAAVSDPDAEQRSLSSDAAGGAKPYGDHRALLDDMSVQAVVIASPNDTHKAILDDIFAARPDLPILVEKPVCTTEAHCEDLAAKAAAHKAPIWVAMEYRYMPPVAELIREVRGGSVGALKMFAIREHRSPSCTRSATGTASPSARAARWSRNAATFSI